MYLDFMFLLNNGDNPVAIVKRVSSYELALLLKSYPEDSYESILETVWTKQGLIEDYFDEELETWIPGFQMPPTWWLVKRIRAEYGPGPLWIKVPAEMLELVEAVRQSPKRRWRTSGKWLKRNNRFHRPWWM
jgi:hypothetical protein